MNLKASKLFKVITVTAAVWALSGCELLEQTKQTSAPVEIIDIDLCDTAKHQASFGNFCDSSHWIIYALDLQSIEWSERLQLTKELGDEPGELVKKILMSQGADTPYQYRLRAQSWILKVNDSAPELMRKLLTQLLYENNKQLLEFESAITILSQVNARQEKTITELQTSLLEREQQIQKQQSQVDQLLKIETDLIEQNREVNALKVDCVEEVRPKLLLIDDDECLLRLMSIRLEGEGFDVTSINNAPQALRLTFNNEFDVVLSDLRMPGMDGMNLFDEILQKHRDLPVILMTAHGTIKDAVAATQRGVYSFITKPVDHKELRKTLLKAVAQSSRQGSMGDWCAEIITRSPDMIRLLKQAEQVADKNVSVLISGASGTGKELLAKAIHNASDRKDKTFVAINCGALPEDLLESELFGHIKGAYTGAFQTTIGLFREADGGTLFLDEIGDMPLTLQVKLLRALQERTVRPVGSGQNIAIDVRIISATHKDLQEAMKTNEFREDLFYRLNVVNLEIPPLKDRFEDIPILADHLLRQSAQKHGIDVIKFADDAISLMSKSDWPGNVRQLVNVVERCVALTSTPIIPASLVEQALSQENKYWPTLTEARDSFEYEYLCKLLQLTQGNVTRSSDLAGRNRTDMHKLMKKHGLVAADFRTPQLSAG